MQVLQQIVRGTIWHLHGAQVCHVFRHAGQPDMSHHFAVVGLMSENLRRHVSVAAGLARHVVPPAGCPLQAEPHGAAPAVAVAAPVLALHRSICEVWVSCYHRSHAAGYNERPDPVK